MTDDQTKQLDDSKVDQLDEGSSADALPSGDDLAVGALSDVQVDDNAADDSSSSFSSSSVTEDEEILKSNELAETLNSLQNLVERYANQLTEIAGELKEKRESLKSVFDNDTQLGEAKAQADVYSTQLKERKSQMQSDPQVTSLKVQISELNEQKKEIEETLSNHLVNYHSMTNSTSFDTSDGDQWEFKIKAKIKTRK